MFRSRVPERDGGSAGQLRPLAQALHLDLLCVLLDLRASLIDVEQASLTTQRRSDYLFFDQFRTIYDEMILNFALCIAAIVFICVLLLHRMSVVLLTGMLITMIDIDLVGSIHFWGLEVNSITIINLIMAIGLVVDYSAHVIHNFGLQ